MIKRVVLFGAEKGLATEEEVVSDAFAVWEGTEVMGYRAVKAGDCSDT